MEYPKTEKVNEKPNEVNTPPKSHKINYDKPIHDVDFLLKDLSNPKQSFEENDRFQAGEDEDPNLPPSDYNPDDDPDNVSPEMQHKQAEGIVEFIDGSAKVGMATYAKNFDHITKYGAKQNEKKLLADAWLPYVEQHGYKIPAWVNLVILNLTVYGPKAVMANNDRRLKRMEKRTDDNDAKIIELQQKIKEMQQNEEPKQEPETQETPET